MGKRHIPHKKRIELLDTYAKSGLTIKEYAAANGIGYSTLQRWLSERKTDLTAMDCIFPLNGTSPQEPKQQPAINRQSYDRSDCTVHFMDITPRSAFSEVPPVKTGEESLNVPEDINPIFTSSASAHRTANLSSKTTPLAPHHQLDISLPNGIRVTFSQASLDMSIALIKSLV